MKLPFSRFTVPKRLLAWLNSKANACWPKDVEANNNIPDSMQNNFPADELMTGPKDCRKIKFRRERRNVTRLFSLIIMYIPGCNALNYMISLQPKLFSVGDGLAGGMP
ncbi:MAG TPA: hypothetical protein VII71_01265 [Verrucomicrobiae bacterium]